MTYQVKYTESTNSAKPALVIEDKFVNTQTSLGFVGQNYSGYAPVLAENFLHLLENFAKSTPPENPVEGQIWYDNTTANALLKVYDGSNWLPTGSITKSITTPTVTSSTNGDLWVNPTTQQLFIFSGTSWSLIGPQFSSGLKTGPIIEAVSDTLADVNDTTAHSIISFYANNERIAILSSDTFVPKAFITGFPEIRRGITLTTDTSATNEAAKLVGTATSADGLNVNSMSIDASNFLRSDVESTTNNAFKIKSNDGLTVGGDLSFNIGIAESAITQTSLNKNIQVKFKDSTNNVSTVLHLDTQKRVGINTILPAQALDVVGSAVISNNLVVGVLTDTIPGTITANGGIIAANLSTFNGEVKSTIGMTVSTPLGATSTVPLPAIVPKISDTFDIGSSSLKFKNIYATTLNGNLNGTLSGNVDGNVSGSAGYLKFAASIKLTGDMASDAVAYNGKDNIEIKTTLSAGYLTGRTQVNTSFNSDLMLVFQNTGASSQVNTISKSNFLASVPIVPIGAILPFAGSIVPRGFLLCDGSEIISSSYPELFTLIGYTYRNSIDLVGDGTFALPDLRGRFPLGSDSMDNTNISKIPAEDGSGLIDARGKRNGTRSGTLAADRVRNPSGKTVGLSSGTDTIGAPAIVNSIGDKFAASSAGQLYSTMNPYLTINYIIFTGKI